MEPFRNAELLRSDLTWFFGNSGGVTRRGALEENASTLLDLAETWCKSHDVRAREIEAVQAFLEEAISRHLKGQEAGFFALFALGPYSDCEAEERHAKASAEFGKKWNYLRDEGKPAKVDLLLEAVMLLIAQDRLSLVTAAQATASDSALNEGITRGPIESLLLHRLNDGATTVLWGEPGNGKSFLARRIAHVWTTDASSVLLIRGGPSGGLANGEYEDDIDRCLAALEAGPPKPTLTQRQVQLRDALSSATGKRVVIFDDLSDSSLTALLPSELSIPALITRRTALVECGEDGNVLVPEYTPTEAVAAARSMLPDEEADDLQLMCDLLGRRPEPINLACRFVRSERRSLSQLIVMLEQAAPTTVENIIGLEGKARPAPLIAFYATIADQFRGVGLTELMLDALIWLNHGPIYPHRLVLQLATDLMSDADQLSATNGWELAVELGLLRKDGESYTMNDLTRNILRALRTGTCERTLSAFNSARRRYRAAGHIRDFDTLPISERLTIIEFWDMCVSKPLEFCRDLFSDDYPPALCAVPLAERNVLVVQGGLTCFTHLSSPLVLVESPLRSDGPYLIWAAGEHARVMSRSEKTAYMAAVYIYEHLVLPELVDREPLFDGPGRVVDINMSGPDGFRHVALDLLTDEYADEQVLWSFCGKRGTWDTEPAVPICPRCVEVEDDEERLRRLFFLCSALAIFALQGAEDHGTITHLAPRVAGMASRAALRAGMMEEAKSHYQLATTLAEHAVELEPDEDDANDLKIVLGWCLGKLAHEISAASVS